VSAWAGTWTSPDDTAKAQTIRNVLAQLKSLAGKVNGYDVIAEDAVTPNLTRVYVLLRYERMPVYAEFVAYSADGRGRTWIVAHVAINTDAVDIIPAPYWKRAAQPAS
jgi:hypothetical protein